MNRNREKTLITTAVLPSSPPPQLSKNPGEIKPDNDTQKWSH